MARKREFLQTAIQRFSEGLAQHGLTAEAAEDPEILATRLVRIAELVYKTVKRPSEHPPVHWEDDDAAKDFDGRLTPEEEARWDASFKENRRMQERVQRAMEKHLSEGERPRMPSTRRCTRKRPPACHKTSQPTMKMARIGGTACPRNSLTMPLRDEDEEFGEDRELPDDDFRRRNATHCNGAPRTS